MSDFNDFKPAFPLPMSFKIQDGKYGMQLGIFKEKGTLKINGVYLNAKVLDGEYGQYGQINPQKIENAPNTDELPF